MNRILTVLTLLSVVLLAGCQKEKFSVSRMSYDRETLFVVHHKKNPEGLDTLVFAVSYAQKHMDGRNLMSITGEGYFYLDDLKVEYRKDGSMVVLNGQKYDLDEGKVLKVGLDDTHLTVSQGNPTGEFLRHAAVSPN